MCFVTGRAEWKLKLIGSIVSIGLVSLGEFTMHLLFVRYEILNNTTRTKADPIQ